MGKRDRPAASPELACAGAGLCAVG